MLILRLDERPQLGESGPFEPALDVRGENFRFHLLRDIDGSAFSQVLIHVNDIIEDIYP